MTEDERQELEELRNYKALMESRIRVIREVTKQKTDANHHTENPNGFGFVNGMRHCVAILKDEEVRYKPKPLEWEDPYYVKMPLEKH